ncbi:MDR family MFS transporter [Actinoallomurus sp. CA-150999]|uniref:MDR family MFS transporter n=1 Tax=Actinoallomurus sp. CA-150999 TaxID=3239887 RepID=UPI003D93504A
MTAALLPSDPPRLGDYTLTARLGEGGQGVVYLAADAAGRQVAIKLLRAHLSEDAKARSRFVRELSAAERVPGFCTAPVIDANVAGDQPYIVSEFVPGPALQELGRLAEPDLLRLAIGTATALAAIHQSGIVHRDFKPANVIMGPGGPRVIDFGIARVLDSDATMTSQVVGTPAYMAPEQLANGAIGPAADLFAWGLTMVFAATGRRAFAGDSVPSVMHGILYGAPDLNGLPPWLAGLVAACLDKDPRRRPTAVQALVHLLGAPPGAPQGDVTTLLTQGAAVATQHQGAVPVPAAPRGVPALALIGVVLGMLASSLPASGVNLAIPAIQAAMHVSVGSLTWVANAQLLGLALTVVVGGWLADRFGRKKLFVIGTAACAAVTFLTALSPTVGVLIALRLVAGVAAGLALPAGLGLVREAFSGVGLNVATGIWGAVTGGAALAGVFLAWPVISGLAWRWVFILPAVVGVLAALIVLVAGRESRGDAAASFSAPGMVFLSAALFVLTFAVIRVRVSNGVVTGVLLVGAVLLVVIFWVVESQMRRGRPPVLLASPSLPAAIGLTAIGFAALNGLYFLLTIYLQVVLNGSPLSTAVGVLPMTLAYVVGAGVAAAVGGRAGPRPSLVIGLLLTMVAAFGLSSLGAHSSYTAVWPWLPFAGLGLGLVIPTAAAAVLGHSPTRLAGAAGGLHQGGQLIGGAVGTSVLYALALPSDAKGSLIAGMHTQLVVIGAMAMVTAVFAVFVRRAEA